MDSLDWSKQYIVFSVSRLDLENLLRFPYEQVAFLSDVDMQRLAEKVRENYGYLEDDFTETVVKKTITSLLRNLADLKNDMLKISGLFFLWESRMLVPEPGGVHVHCGR